MVALARVSDVAGWLDLENKTIANDSNTELSLNSINTVKDKFHLT